MTTKGMKVGRPTQLPCPCCGMPVLTRPALSIIVALYCARTYGAQDLTLYDIERVTGTPVRSARRTMAEFSHLFWCTGKVDQQKTWALTVDGFNAVRRLFDETKEKVA